MTKVIIFLFLFVPCLGFSQKLSCDSIHAYYDSITSHSIGRLTCDEPPRPRQGLKPIYIPNTNDLKAGKIIVEFIVGKQGEVLCARVLKADNNALVEKAILLVKKMVFTPAKQNGKPINMPMVWVVKFGAVSIK